MKALILALILLVYPPPMTVRDCLLRYGDSAYIYDHPELAAIVGVSAGEGYRDVLAYGERVGAAHIQTDTELREIRYYAWQGAFYIFVYRAWDSTAQPPAREPMADGSTAWHGSCMLRIGP